MLHGMGAERFSKTVAAIPSAICMVLVAAGAITDDESVKIVAAFAALVPLLVYAFPANELTIKEADAVRSTPTGTTVLPLLLMLLLVGCAPGQQQTLTAERRLQIACGAYANTLDRLAVQERRGFLSESAGNRVDLAVEIIEPICLRKRKADMETMLADAERAVLTMMDEVQP
jgi:hypothetical protein